MKVSVDFSSVSKVMSLLETARRTRDLRHAFVNNEIVHGLRHLSSGLWVVTRCPAKLRVYGDAV